VRLGGSAGLVLALALAVASQASAQAPSAGETREKLDAKRGELEKVQARAKWLAEDAEEINAERERINARLLETAALIQRSEGQLTRIEARLGELEAQEKLLRGSLQQRHGQIAKLLGALQRMGRNPPPVMMTRRDDALEMVRSAMLLATTFPELRDQALSLSGKLDELVRIVAENRAEGEKLKAETDRLNEQRTKLAGLMQEKKQTLTERQSELVKVRQAANEISKSVADLNELIHRLDRTITESTDLGKYDAEARHEPTVAKAAANAPATAGAPGADKPVDTPRAAGSEPKPGEAAPPARPEVVVLAPSTAGQVLGSTGRIKPAIPFHQAKARLPLPAQGRRVLAFGEKTQYGGESKGIVLETRSGAQITSPCDGWIVYAGEFRSYGKLLIINAGGGYHVLLAGLSRIDVQPGQFVLAAEPVGTVSGAAAKSQGNAQEGAPVLYVEFRKDGRPIDPDPWWVEGHQKVQG
jgi:septal ring factor EnvC (AmiA/AmiB activator)